MSQVLNSIAYPQTIDEARGKRFLSLDIFRGLTICLMIIVNTPGKGAPFYPVLVHAPWFGFTLADLVFPSFLFAMGNSMSFSAHATKIADITFLRKVVYRSCLLFVIGILMYWFPFIQQRTGGSWSFISFDTTRIMGVLQRIAICYLVASLLVRYFPTRAVAAVTLAILVGYWKALYVWGDPGAELTMAGNAIIKLDIWLLGEGHVYKKDLIPFDPEGVLSTLPAIVNVLAGYWVGKWIQMQKNTRTAVHYLLIAGTLLVITGWVWGSFFPISKKLWTSSFTVFTIGIDVLIVSLLIYCFELRVWAKDIYFFSVLGRNPLVTFLFSELFYVVLSTIKVNNDQSVFHWVSVEIFQQIMPGPAGAMLTAITFMLMCWMLAWVLDKNKVYVRI